MKRWKLLALAATSAGFLVAPLAAQAALELRMDDSTTAGIDVSVVDGGIGDINPLAGVITYLGAAGSWTINVSTGLGSAVYVPGFGLDLNSVNVSSVASTLSISFSENNLNAGAAGLFPVNGKVGGTTGGSVAYSLYVDDSNALFGEAATAFAGAAGTGAFANAGGSTLALTDPFSMTLAMDITHAGPALTSFDFEATVPEPASLALLGIGLLGLGTTARRRKV